MGRVAAELLAQPQGNSILEVGAADFDHLRPLLRPLGQQGPKGLQRGDQPLLQFERHGHMQRGGEGVVARLAQVHMVVRMHRLLAAQLPSEGLNRSVGDHLIGIHVGLGSGAGLPDLQRKFAIQLAAGHLLRRRHDRGGQGGIQAAQVAVHFGAGGLELAEGMHHRQRHALAEGKEMDRALRLGAPVLIRRHHHGPEAVALAALRPRRAGFPP